MTGDMTLDLILLSPFPVTEAPVVATSRRGARFCAAVREVVNP